MTMTPAQRSRQRRASINARRELPETTGNDKSEATEEQMPLSEFLAGCIAIVATAWSAWQAWQYTWPRLWVWHFGPDTSGADSVWNREPIYGLMVAFRTLGETIIITAVAALVAGGVTLGVILLVLRIVRPKPKWSAMKKLLLALLVALIGLGVLVIFGVVETRDAPFWVGGIVGAWLGCIWVWVKWQLIGWSGPRGDRKVGEAVLRAGQRRLEQKQRKEVRDGSDS